MNTPRYETDPQFETHTIASFRGEKDGSHSLAFEDGWSFHMPACGFAPEVGQPARLYGRGIGYEVRGLIVNDREVFYRTEAEQEALNAKELAEQKAKQIADYDAKADEYDRRVMALPEPFRMRIEGFRNHRPGKWKYEFEPYELFTCEQAVAIADALKTTEAIGAFYKLDKFADQKALVPVLLDEHSGNTFGTACLLARIYLEQPDAIPKTHGALCPLVGCEDYGCFAARKTITP